MIRPQLERDALTCRRGGCFFFDDNVFAAQVDPDGGAAAGLPPKDL